MGPITFTLTGILVALLVIVLMKLFKTPHARARCGAGRKTWPI